MRPLRYDYRVNAEGHIDAIFFEMAEGQNLFRNGTGLILYDTKFNTNRSVR
jgi:hypothetical protein